MDACKRIGGFDISGVMETIEGCDDTFHYRNKVEFSVDTKHGIIGKHLRGSSSRLTGIEECMLQSKGAHKIYKDVHEYLMNDGALLEEIEYIVIRWSQAYATALVNIVTKRNILGHLKTFGDYLSKKHGKSLTGIVNSVSDSTRPLEERRIVQEEVVCGRPELMEKLGSCLYRISPNSFFQVHTAQTEKMYDFIMNAVAESSDKQGVVLDLYCGAGSIAIFLAQKAKYVYGVEISQSSIDDARYNCTLNNVTNVEFIHGDVIDTFSSIDAIVVDPARKGLSSNALQGIVKINPTIVVYVSCNVATQARDVKQICESGQYDVISVKPFDLFPQTVHVENVVICKRKDGV
jgi:23S rRNA (uracil1939-C5)-methyltransferase